MYGTWNLFLEEIKRRASGQSSSENAQAAKAAIMILQICAFFHHSNISRDIFQSAAEKSRKKNIKSKVAKKLLLASTLLDYTLLPLDDDGYWDDFIFGQGISILLYFSLIKREYSSGMYSIHPLLHCWSQEHMIKSEQQKMWELGGAILSCAIPWGFPSQCYAFQQLLFLHIKANELHGHQMELMKQYYDDKYVNFAIVMGENGD